MPLVIGWILGLLLGMRHAFEPDHLAAVSALLAEQPRARRAALLGAWWGIGHSAALLVVGGVLFAVRAELPARLGDLFELVVAVMLLGLGVRGLRRAFQAGTGGVVTAHRHDGVEHRHAGPVEHVHVGRWTFARRPFFVGLVHGLAGSGALTALALTSMPTVASGLLYIVLFGFGSVVGMALLTGVAGLSLRRVIQSERGHARLTLLTSTFSIALGFLWGVPLALCLFASCA